MKDKEKVEKKNIVVVEEKASKNKSSTTSKKKVKKLIDVSSACDSLVYIPRMKVVAKRIFGNEKKTYSDWKIALKEERIIE